ncbi:unnamed protein product [Trichogramma brassicae]|uniref:Uncharacterized protein n=1 Tax=Trichogramma brassicae TaxID=86971 RepID=A0A6H5IRN9_9HYME|nr:unnamed protein product [Trichogramma brassicae]
MDLFCRQYLHTIGHFFCRLQELTIFHLLMKSESFDYGYTIEYYGRPTRCSKCEYRPGDDFLRGSRDVMATMFPGLTVETPRRNKICINQSVTRRTTQNLRVFLVIDRNFQRVLIELQHQSRAYFFRTSMVTVTISDETIEPIVFLGHPIILRRYGLTLGCCAKILHVSTSCVLELICSDLSRVGQSAVAPLYPSLLHTYAVTRAGASLLAAAAACCCCRRADLQVEKNIHAHTCSREVCENSRPTAYLSYAPSHNPVNKKAKVTSSSTTIDIEFLTHVVDYDPLIMTMDRKDKDFVDLLLKNDVDADLLNGRQSKDNFPYLRNSASNRRWCLRTYDRRIIAVISEGSSYMIRLITRIRGFVSKKPCVDYCGSLKLRGSRIEAKESAKYLGVILDRNVRMECIREDNDLSRIRSHSSVQRGCKDFWKKITIFLQRFYGNTNEYQNCIERVQSADMLEQPASSIVSPVVVAVTIHVLRKRTQPWCRKLNRYSLNITTANPDKLNLVLFSRRHRIDDFRPITFKGVRLEVKEATKYLGVTLERKLRWKPTWRNRAKKLLGPPGRLHMGTKAKVALWFYEMEDILQLAYAAVVWWT